MDRKFYEKTLRPDRQDSYRAISDCIVSMFHPDKVVDYGCGAGWILYYLMHGGVDNVLGIEPNPEIEDIAPDSIKKFIQAKDLAKPVFTGFSHDVAICMEVAEHIHEVDSNQLIKNICQDAPVLFFTAAPPGQGGYSHFNEKPQSYWEKKIKREGMLIDPVDTATAAGFLRKAKAKSWYIDNLMIFKRK